MRQLHFVEHEAGSDHVVVATADDLERFELTIDTALRDAVKPPPAPPAPVGTTAARPTASDPKISPREIQMRVRGGDTAEQLAEEFGASLDWVMRFATPVLAERTRIADESRRAKARRSTTEGQTVVFGEAVDERFAAHGIDPTSVRWGAHRREDAQWIVTAHWIGGQSERTAEWAFNLSGRTVAPIDDTAADLLSDRPIRPVVAPDPELPPNLTLAPPLQPGIVAFPAMPDAHTGPLPRAEELFDQAQYDHGQNHPARYDQQQYDQQPYQPPQYDQGQYDQGHYDQGQYDQGQYDQAQRPQAEQPPFAQPPFEPALTEQAQVHQARVEQPPAAPDSFDDAPPLPMHVPGHPATTRIPKVTNLGVAQRGDETEDEKAARATIPSWDDILLGVRRKRD